MVRTSLTPELIAAGARFVRELDARGIHPVAVFWLFNPEAEAWKLVVAEVELGEKGPQEFYRRYQRVLAALSEDDFTIQLTDVSLEKPDALIVSALRSAASTRSGVGGVWFHNNVIDGTLVEDAYVYRVA